MRLAELTVFVTLAWTGPQYPPPPRLNKDVIANLKTEGPLTLEGTLGFILLGTLALIAAYFSVEGPYWCAIVALVLFFATVGLLARRSIRKARTDGGPLFTASPNWKGLLAGLVIAVIGFVAVYFGESRIAVTLGAAALLIGGFVAFVSLF